jgi:SSS family solute:Na+ symporter
MFYGWMSWQGTQGYRAAAKTPHEARMAMILNNWRSITQQLTILIIPICAYTFMHHPDFSESAQIAKNIISNIAGRTPVETQTLQTQMTVPIVMSLFLKTGLTGIFCAVMVAAFISIHDTYLHSWGSIFIQDVVMPFRKKPITPKQHINLLRLSILGVALFIFLFGMLYRQNEYILMFFAFTGTIFVGGAGAVVIGGLYWSRGTTTAAWSALILGIVMAFAGAIIRRIWPDFPINSMWIYFITAIACSMVYVVISLIEGKQCDMDKMLHRGKYAVTDDLVKADIAPVRGFKALIAMGPEFTRSDKFIYISSVVWSLLLGGVFIVGTILYWFIGIENESWSKFWWFYIIIQFILSVITTVWFIVGGLHDYKDMFRRLKTLKSNDLDNGRVIDEAEDHSKPAAKQDVETRTGS